MSKPDPVVECAKYMSEPQRRILVALVALGQRKGHICPACLFVELAVLESMSADDFLAYATELSEQSARQRNSELS